MTELIFYLFAFMLTLASVLVISLRNPVHAVLFLIFAFFNAAAIFIMIGAEFIAMTLIIVYVGAVAVLFLFVVMMLNINISTLRDGFHKHLPLGIALAGLIFIEIIIAVKHSIGGINKSIAEKSIVYQTNTHEIGNVLYTDYFFVFQASGVVLFIAMIGSILLTLVHDTEVKRQDIHKQITRDPKDSVRLVKVKNGAGVKLYPKQLESWVGDNGRVRGAYPSYVTKRETLKSTPSNSSNVRGI